jgi:hypothetical protein
MDLRNAGKLTLFSKALQRRRQTSLTYDLLVLVDCLFLGIYPCVHFGRNISKPNNMRRLLYIF